MSERTLHARRVQIGLLVVLVAVLFVVLCPPLLRTVVRAYEDASLHMHPSGARAYGYANMHFDSRYSGLYDIARAKDLFEQALALEPTLLNVRHQLGRVAFIQGDYDKAMVYLDAEITMPNGPGTPSSYYVRGLIEGYIGEYDAAIDDYAKYLATDPSNWAAQNDYAWVLLKANRPAEALLATDNGLTYFPDNPWLLNSYATALFELHRYEEALVVAERAELAARSVTTAQWLTAYPGNDPRIAKTGISTLQESVEKNLVLIREKVATPTRE